MLIVLFVLLLEAITNFGNPTLVILMFMTVFFSLIINIKKNFKYFILFFLISYDNSRFSSEFVVQAIASIYTIPSFNMLVTIIASCVLLLIYMLKGKVLVAKDMKALVYFNLFILCMGLICGLSYSISYPRIAIQDASYFINPMVFMLATYLIYKDDHKHFHVFLNSIVLAISIKLIILLFLFFTGNGEVVGSMVKVTGDSGKSLFGLYATVFILLFAKNTSVYRFAYLFMFLVSILLLFSAASRSSMLFIVIALGIALFFLDETKTKKVKYISFSVIGIFFSILSIELIHPNAINNILWKLTTFNEIDIYAEKHRSLSALTRYIEILNIYYQHLADNTLFLGAGFGSYFTDSHVPFPYTLYGTDSYRDEWIDNRTFFKPHTTPIFFFLKIGLGGVFIYYFVYIKVVFKLREYLPSIKNNIEYCFALAIMSNILLLITKNFSSKMQIALGIFMAIALIILRQQRIKNNGIN